MSNKSIQYCGLIIFFGLIIPVFQAQALTIAPERIDEELAPGDSFAKNIRVFNESRAPVLVSPELGVLPVPDQRTVQVAETPAKELMPELVSYNPDSFELAPGAWKDFPLEIHVPPAFEAGGYYGTLLFQFREQVGNNGEVGIVGKVGTLVLLSVIGPVRTNIEYLGMALGQSDKKLFDHVPGEFLFKLKNTGDVHVAPHGTFIIKSWWGGERERIEVNLDDRVLLPGWERIFVETFAETEKSGLVRELQRFGLGPYHAELSLTLGDKVVHDEMWFLVIPGKLLGLGALIIVVLLVLRRIVSSRTLRVP